jgi:hypothetical protein
MAVHGLNFGQNYIQQLIEFDEGMDDEYNNIRRFQF